MTTGLLFVDMCIHDVCIVCLRVCRPIHVCLCIHLCMYACLAYVHQWTTNIMLVSIPVKDEGCFCDRPCYPTQHPHTPSAVVPACDKTLYRTW